MNAPGSNLAAVWAPRYGIRRVVVGVGAIHRDRFGPLAPCPPAPAKAPIPADPNNAAEAFVAYAGDRLWVASHLAQLTGIVLALATLLVLGRQLETNGGGVWVRLASAGAIASLALAAALQAVDGIALRAMVENWATAVAGQKDSAFQSAFAVRQVEIGLASVLSLVLGVAAALYGVALLDGLKYPRWAGGLAIASGVPTALSGVVMASSGFSDLEMAINMPASALLLVWLLALGVLMWWRDRSPSGKPAA